MKAFFHSADLDGNCAGAIVLNRYQSCEMIGINYGQAFPWERIGTHETVFMVDFTLQPFELMERLAGACNLIWIDHHKTEVEEAERRGFKADGIRRVGIGACALVWEYLYPGIEMPTAVRLLAEYDVFNHSDPRTLPFQYGMRNKDDTWPENIGLWFRLFSDTGELVDEICAAGKTILEYERRQNRKFCRAYAFETVLYSDGNQYRAICANRGFTNSMVFDGVYDPTRHDLMMTFVRLKLPARKWTVSLYSDKPEIDCGQIARTFGGGGHKGAAGMQVDKLPFDH